MSFSKTKLILPFVALAGPCLACGPFFPATIIDSDSALLAAPYARFAVSMARIPQRAAEFHATPVKDNETFADQTLGSEIADLTAAGVSPDVIERHRVRRLALIALPLHNNGEPLPPEIAATTGLPEEFADYHTAACAFAFDGIEAAERIWKHLLTLPAGQRKYKSTWAAFMLGRVAENAVEARAYFQQTRRLAHEGFVDSCGLAAASFGWEAKSWLDAGDFPRAAELYLAQFATGDATADNSLRFLATRALAVENAGSLAAFARDAHLRDVITALLLAQREDEMFPQFVDNAPNVRSGATTRWLTQLEHAGVKDAPHAARLAMAAYRANEIESCERWLKFAAAGDDLTLWLRAKLALRAGHAEEAARDLSILVTRSKQHAKPLEGWSVFEDSDLTPISAEAHATAELGALKLARRDYTEALELLLQSGYWEDSAFVAERVLTVDELKRFVDARSAGLSLPKKADDERIDSRQDLRHLLARRLMRRDRLEEASAYFPENIADTFKRFTTLLSRGRDQKNPVAERAAALMDAARLLRSDGIELCGAELAPDFAIWGGSFDQGFEPNAREALSPVLRSSIDERNRTAIPDSLPLQRFHYRSTAADLAWEAIAFMPDNDNDTAAALVEAGGWLKARDPKGANRFYQALVRRCGATELGRTAKKDHWFPKGNL